MMSQSVGFEWGFRPSVSSSVLETESASVAGTAGPSMSGSAHRIAKPRAKRRLGSEDMASSSSSHGLAAASSGRGHAGAGKRRPMYRNFIHGQPLPFPRAVELMDKQSLQSVLLGLVRMHPEIQHTLVKMQPLSFTVEQYVKVLKEKLGQVYEDVPYSKYNQGCDLLNDYAFGRMKASILEFLNSVIDFLLSSIPPQSDNLGQSLKFLDCCTELLLQLPDFETVSNNYYKNMCFEQVSEIWCNVLQFASANLVFMAVNSNLEEWKHVIQSFDKRSHGKLHKPLQLISSIISEGGAIDQENALPLAENSAAAASAVGFLNISS